MRGGREYRTREGNNESTREKGLQKEKGQELFKSLYFMYFETENLFSYF